MNAFKKMDIICQGHFASDDSTEAQKIGHKQAHVNSGTNIYVQELFNTSLWDEN